MDNDFESMGGISVPSVMSVSDPFDGPAEVSADDTPVPAPLTLEECLSRPTEVHESEGMTRHIPTLAEELAADRRRNMARPVAKAYYSPGSGVRTYSDLSKMGRMYAVDSPDKEDIWGRGEDGRPYDPL